MINGKYRKARELPRYDVETVRKYSRDVYLREITRKRKGSVEEITNKMENVSITEEPTSPNNNEDIEEIKARYFIDDSNADDTTELDYDPRPLLTLRSKKTLTRTLAPKNKPLGRLVTRI